MVVGKRDIRETDNVRVLLQRLEDTAARERFLTKTGADVAQDTGLDRVVLVEQVLQGRVGGSEAVDVVLRKDPGRVRVRRLLGGELSVEEERVARQDV